MTSRPLLVGAGHDLRRDAVGTDDDRGALVDLVELLDRDDALLAQTG